MVPSTSGDSGRGGSAALPRSVQTLIELGFSQYEARTYVGLVGRPPMTGYAISKDTRVPQPKTYEALGRLAERGVVVQVGTNPAVWAAVPAGQMLGHLDNDFKRRLTAAELRLTELDSASTDTAVVRPYREVRSLTQMVAVATELIAIAESRIYLSGYSDQIAGLGPSMIDADERRVRIDVLCSGEPPFALRHGIVDRHRSTEGTVYPHHQSRHVALIVDGVAAMWALARNGRDWTGIWTEHDDLLPAAVKGFVSHDIWAQRIFNDFKDELNAAYGPSLQYLVHPIASEESAADDDHRGGPAVRPVAAS
ncbi:TrmB family transcriptional regulator [Streptomyces sp. NPDC001984]